MSVRTVLLFDIDGTLVSTSGAGRRAIERTFARLYDRADACAKINFGGMTDRAIARSGLEAIGVDATDAAIDALLEDYLGGLEDELSRATCKVHEGVEEAIAVGERAGFAVGLGTGNVERGARTKLRRVGLDQRFSFGGFGCDHELRHELLRRGAERGATLLGRSREDCRVVVIGDTPRDIAAAQAIGAESIAVATGGASLDVLVAANPTRAFASLAAPGALDALLEP
jgi:phosphoglycolate phosphatase-like HAD superfamily hydrolase